MAGVVRRDGLREAVTALRDTTNRRAITLLPNEQAADLAAEFADDLSRVLDAVPDVPPATPLANHIKAGMLRGRVRLSDVPPDPPAAEASE